MTERPEELELLAVALAEALRETEPLNEVVAARAIEGFTWRSIDDDLLAVELLGETPQDWAQVATRGEETPHTLTFSADLKSVEIEILRDELIGQFSPPVSGVVEVEREGTVVARVEVDQHGFFAVAPRPTGIVRLRCRTATTRLVTDWFRS